MDPSLIRKYISYAKRNIFPTYLHKKLYIFRLSLEAGDCIKNYYLSLRENNI